jgi:hypothetical protein
MLASITVTRSSETPENNSRCWPLALSELATTSACHFIGLIFSFCHFHFPVLLFAFCAFFHSYFNPFFIYALCGFMLRLFFSFIVLRFISLLFSRE